MIMDSANNIVQLINSLYECNVKCINRDFVLGPMKAIEIYLDGKVYRCYEIDLLSVK